MNSLSILSNSKMDNISMSVVDNDSPIYDGDDDDFDLTFKPVDQQKKVEAERIIDRIMNNAMWLWRQASSDDLCTIKGQTEPEGDNGYRYTMVSPSAYYRNGNENSLSLFQIRKEIRAKEIKFLQVEANIFLAFLSIEIRDVMEKTRPVALIKERLIKNSLNHDLFSLLPQGITVTSESEDDKCMGCHWDIHLTSQNTVPEKLNTLYGVLAQSSQPYRNNLPNRALTNKNKKA